MTITTRRALNIIAIVCFTLLVAVLLIAYLSPATGYELSIYDHTPAVVWAFLIVSITGGVTIVIHQVATKGYENSKFWLIGLSVVVLAQVALLCLPYIRGYVGWRGDTMSHVGLVTDILSNGRFGSDNFYPVTHTLLAEIVVVTGISKLTAVILSSALLPIMYTLSIYLLATALLPGRGQQLLAVASTASMPCVLNMSGFAPVHWSILAMPLFLFLYFRRRSPAYNISLVMFLILYPFFHVFSSLMILVALVVIELSRKAYTIIIERRKLVTPVRHFKSSSNPMSPIMMGSAILFLWILSFQIFHKNVQLLWEQITTGVGPDVLGGMGEALLKINVHGLDFVVLLFKMYGVAIIFIVISLIAGFILTKRIYSGNIERESHSLFGLLGVFLLMGFLYLLFLLGMPGLQSIQPTRILHIAIVFTPIFVGFGLYELVKGVRFRYLASTCVICVIALASGLAIFALYASPYVTRPNNQSTSMDIAGMTWFIEQKDSAIGCVDIMTPPGRFATSILGSVEARKRADLDRGRYHSEKIPDHFAYTDRSSLGESYAEDRYSVITKFDRALYTTVWKELGRFNYGDFEKLECDATVDRLYSNGELDIYYVHGTGGQ